jgi:ATP-dependent Lon protease
VGKTQLSICLAEAMGLPFAQISLGGMRDVHVLTGHSPTYIGARPGAIVGSLEKMGYCNGVLFLDEFDKITDTAEGKAIYSTLLHILDYAQNSHFQDMYMPEIPINLSNLLIVIAMNDDTQLDPYLRDRLSIVKINPYTLEERIIIGLEYMIPKICKRLDFNANDIQLSSSTMKHLISKIKKEEGVRSLERALNTIYERINVIRQLSKTHNTNKKIKLSYSIPNFKLPLIITNQLIDMLFKD